MRVTSSKVFYIFPHSVSSEAKKEIEGLDLKQAQGDAVGKGIIISDSDVI